jgi:hypothetical protein
MRLIGPFLRQIVTMDVREDPAAYLADWEVLSGVLRGDRVVEYSR